jgi:phosphonate transport system permease protein
MTNTLDIAAERARHPEAFRSAGLLYWLLVGGAVAYLGYLLWLFDFVRVFSQLPRAWVILRLMLDWSQFLDWDHAELWRSMLETVAMAYLGSMLAAVFAVPLGFLGARNIIPARLFHFVTRRLFDGMRGIDQLIWALVFVRAMGLGPIAGIMAIAVVETGVLAKLFAEAVENIDRRQIEGITATGAGVLGRLRYGVLPQVLPVMIS